MSAKSHGMARSPQLAGESGPEHRSRCGSVRVEISPNFTGESFSSVEVIRPGLLTTVQDLGRTGFQKYGVPTSGAMDQTALRAANLLVGNEESAAGLEATGEGPVVRALGDLIVAVVGAEIDVLVDGKPAESGVAIAVRTGQILELGRARQGLRAYLAIAGGIDVPVMLGSRSTCLPAGFGGFRGRPLREGDLVAIGPRREESVGFTTRRLPPGWFRPIAQTLSLRAILGPQEDRFRPEGVEAFLCGEYRLTPEMDRMGVRLQGPPIAHRSGADILSDSIPLGSVQVPADGQPIILLADRQTTGGYTKIAVVLREDTYQLAQARPGHAVRFRQVSVAEAHASLRTYEAKFRMLRRAWQLSRGRKSYALGLAGKVYEIGVEEGGRSYRVTLQEQAEQKREEEEGP